MSAAAPSGPSRRLTIVMVAACPFPANYGSPAAIKELSEALVDAGHEIHIVTYPYGDDIPLRGGRLHRISNLGASRQVSVGPALHKPLLDLLLVFKVCQVIRKYKCDLIHAHNYEGQLVGTCAKFLTGAPLLYNAVSSLTDELPSYRFIRPAFLARWLASLLDWIVPRFADYTLVLTEHLLEFLVSKGVPRDRIVFLPAGVSPDLFLHGDANRFRDVLDLRDHRVVLYTGTLDYFQRLDVLFRAFACLGPEFADAVLLIVNPFTNPSARKELEVLAHQLGISCRLRWVSRHQLEDLPDYLALGDVAVAARPHSSGQPIKILNYMSSARPIVAPAGGAKGIRHLENGFVCRDEDPEDMARGIATLLRDRVLAARLGQAAQETARKEYDWRMICRKIEALYFCILSGRSARHSVLATEECESALR